VSSIWGENSPLVIHEAQSCKIPVITANFGGMKEYVADGINGLLFTHRDEESLREKLQFAVDNPKKMMGLGLRGYLYSYSGEIPNIIKHCEELKLKYKEIINNG
jgi:glycosyltransferase involved in cell wall biosynthesis